MRMTTTFGLLAALGTAGCALPDTDSFRAPDLNLFKPRSVAELRTAAVRPVTAQDLVDGEGRCAEAAEPGAENVPAIPSGVALEMTECEVVRRLGAPERVNVGSNEANDRTATLTYTRGDRPGVYVFTGGRLTQMERAPDAAPVRPAKPQRKPARQNATR